MVGIGEKDLRRMIEDSNGNLIQTDSLSGRVPEKTSAPDIRRCKNWIESFLEYNDGLNSPKLFRKWAAIGAIAGAAERRIWTNTNPAHEPLYPNMYISLVGDPSSGKTLAVKATKKMWKSCKELNVAPDAMTKAGMLDAVAAAKRIVPIGNGFVEYHSLLLATDELSTLLPSEYDFIFMGTLNKFYDNEDEHIERLRTRKPPILHIIRPQMTFVIGAQPQYLASTMPEAAWGQGFLSRNILLFHKPLPPVPDIFAEETPERKFLRLCLEDDLKAITKLSGEMRWTTGARDAINQWNNSGRKPFPRHPKMEHYNGRRLVHLIKAAMVASLSHSSSLLITEANLTVALNWLQEAEATTPQIFSRMGIGGNSAILWDCWNAMSELSKSNIKGWVEEQQVVRFLSERVDSHLVLRTVEAMESAGMLQQTSVTTQRGTKTYRPLPQKDHTLT